MTALTSHARKVPVPVSVEAPGIGRYPKEVEAAVYFCCLEALQNTVKYAEASSVVVQIEQSDGTLTFSVTDDGRGFDPAQVGRGTGCRNMADRLEALDGRLDIDSTVGVGTRIVGTIPVGSPMDGSSPPAGVG